MAGGKAVLGWHNRNSKIENRNYGRGAAVGNRQQRIAAVFGIIRAGQGQAECADLETGRFPHRGIIPGAVGQRQGLAAQKRPHGTVAVELEESRRHLRAERAHDAQRGLHRWTPEIPAARDHVAEQVEPRGRETQLVVTGEDPLGHRLVDEGRHQPDRVVVRPGHVDETGAVGADLPAQFQPGAEIRRRHVAPRDFAQQVLVVEDPHRVHAQADGVIIAVLVDVRGAAPAAVNERQAPRHAREFRAGVVRVGLVHPARDGRKISRQLGDIGLVGGVEADEVGDGAGGELGAEPLAVDAAGHGELLDADVGVQRHVALGDEVEGLAHAGLELPVGEADHQPRRTMGVGGRPP